MFTIYPDGQESGGSTPSSPFYAGLSYFGRLALYYTGVRIAYVFFGERAEQRAIAN